MRFKFEQGGNLFAFVLCIGLVGLLIVGLMYFPQVQPQSASNNAPAALYVVASTATTTPQANMPKSIAASEMGNGHWAELCQGQTCIRARWFEQQGMFQLLDGKTWIDPTGYSIYPMALETDLEAGMAYSICDMPGWNTIWWHHQGDEHNTALEGCMVLTYVGPDGVYQEFTQDGTTQIWFNQVSFNAYPYVFPMDTSR